VHDVLELVGQLGRCLGSEGHRLSLDVEGTSRRGQLVLDLAQRLLTAVAPDGFFDDRLRIVIRQQAPAETKHQAGNHDL
jgi:hypothetical protein